MVSPPGAPPGAPAGDPAGDPAIREPWEQVVEAHLRVVRRIHPPAVVEVLARRAGFAIHPAAGNAAAAYADVLRYLLAVRGALGQGAWVSAKFTVISRMRELGLSADLRRPVFPGAPPGAPAGR